MIIEILLWYRYIVLKMPIKVFLTSHHLQKIEFVFDVLILWTCYILKFYI